MRRGQRSGRLASANIGWGKDVAKPDWPPRRKRSGDGASKDVKHPPFILVPSKDYKQTIVGDPSKRSRGDSVRLWRGRCAVVKHR